MAITIDNFAAKAQNRSLFSKIFGTNLTLDETGRGLKAPNKFRNWVVNCYKELILRQSNKIKDDNKAVRTSFLTALKNKYGNLIGNRMQQSMAANTQAGKALSGFRVRQIISQAEAMQVAIQRANRKENDKIAHGYMTDPSFKPLYDAITREMGVESRFDSKLRSLHTDDGGILRRDVMNRIRQSGKNGQIRISRQRAKVIAEKVIRQRLIENISRMQQDNEFKPILDKLSVDDLKYLKGLPLAPESRIDNVDQVLKAKIAEANKTLLSEMTLLDEPYFAMYDQVCKETGINRFLDATLKSNLDDAESAGFNFRRELRNRIMQNPILTGNQALTENACKNLIERELYIMLGEKLFIHPNLKDIVHKLSPEILSATLANVSKLPDQHDNGILLKSIAEKQIIGARDDFRKAMDNLFMCEARDIPKNILSLSQANFKIEKAYRHFANPGKEFGNDDRVRLFNTLFKEATENKSAEEMQNFYARLTSPDLQNLYGAIDLLGVDLTTTTDQDKLALGAGLLRITEGLRRMEETFFNEAGIPGQNRSPIGSQRVTYRNMTEDTRNILENVFGLTVQNNREIDENIEKSNEIRGLISGL